MNIPVKPPSPIDIRTAHTGKLGTWAFFAEVGDFTGTRVVVDFADGAVTLDSDIPGDGLSWSGGALDDLTLTAAQVDTLSAIGSLIHMTITLHEAAPSTELHLFGVADVRISDA